MEAAKLNNTVSSSGSSLQQQPVTTPSMPQVMMNMNMGNNSNNNGGTTTTTTATGATIMKTATTNATTTQEGSSGGGQGSFDLFGKKKRGRPRKYDKDGNLSLTYQKSATTTTTPPPPPGFGLSPISASSQFSSKRGRGRPAGSTNWQLFAASFGEAFANTAGGDFTPHVVTVQPGEDVAGKIMSFAQKGPGGVCILSANGAISNVAIRQPGSSAGILTYEGRFEILSLSGSYTISETSSIRSRSGGLSVSLAGPDGRVIGGGVAGLLTAAGPIQIVMGSFMPNGYKIHKRKYRREPKVASPISGGQDTVTAARPISQANPPGENFMVTTSQVQEQSQRESISATTTSGDTQNLDATPNVATWNGSEVFSDQRISPDINISLPDE